jgi:hypothetical protein
MKEYDQFMQQVKGKKKTEAPVDTFGKEWTKKDKLGNPDYNVGYDPNYRLSAPSEEPSKPKRVGRPNAVERFAMAVEKFKPEIEKREMMQKMVEKISSPMNRRKLTPVESKASLERMINRFMQQGLSPETARKLAMERMYA